MDKTRPNWEFLEMIEEFRSNLEYDPISNSDPIIDHQINVCVRKRPINKKGDKGHESFFSPLTLTYIEVVSLFSQEIHFRRHTIVLPYLFRSNRLVVKKMVFFPLSFSWLCGE